MFLPPQGRSNVAPHQVVLYPDFNMLYVACILSLLDIYTELNHDFIFAPLNEKLSPTNYGGGSCPFST